MTLTKEKYIKENHKSLSKNIIHDIKLLINGKYDTSQDIMLRDATPKALIEIGIANLPMLMNSSHVLENILSEKEAKEKNIYNKDGHYHNLGIRKFVNIIENLDYPEKIFKKNNKDYIILTKQYDKDGFRIIVPIFIETVGNYNRVTIRTNKIKTIYGKKSLNQYIKRNLKNRNFSIEYKEKKN